MTPGDLSARWTFAILVLAALALTFVAARRTRGASAFFDAGGGLGATANGIAISAEFTSAASLLGVIALIYDFGADALLYLTSTCVGFVFVTLVMAERYRAMGKVTMADVLSTRFDSVRLRRFSAVSSLAVVAGYMISQLASGSHLLSGLFGIGYFAALTVITALVAVFVAVGGMLAATWIQMIKAALFVGGLTVLSGITLAAAGWNPGVLLARAGEAHALGTAWMVPGAMTPGLGASLSLALMMAFGVAGLPHILIRFCTVPDPVTARRSMQIATMIVCLVVATYFVVALGAIAAIPAGANQAGSGSNLVFLDYVRSIAGDTVLGLVAAGVFATILAVVAGLVLAAASALVRDLLPAAGDDRRALLRSRIASVAAIVAGALLALAFGGLKLGFVMTLAFAIAASANFPVLLLALHWSALTERGAWAGGVSGLSSALVLAVAGPTIWVDVLGHATPLFPYREPAIVAMPLAFAAAMLVSVLDRRRATALQAKPAI